jgi:hypothetical protein
MQYLLTQEEYDERNAKAAADYKQKLADYQKKVVEALTEFFRPRLLRGHSMFDTQDHNDVAKLLSAIKP